MLPETTHDERQAAPPAGFPDGPAPGRPATPAGAPGGADAAHKPAARGASLAVRMPGPLRVALVGAGYIADYHLDVLRELAGVEALALVDTDVARARALAEKHGVPHVLDDIARLPELGIEVAHVLVPPNLHAKLVQALLELGIGVFVEKPFVLGSAEARLLAALASRNGLALGVNHNNLFHPAFRRLLDQVRAGRIGRVEHVQVTLSVPLMQLDAQAYAHWMFGAPANIVFEQAVHPLCQVHALIGRVRRVQVDLLSTRELFPEQVFHDRWAISADAERGTAQVYLAFGRGFTRNTIQVIGSDGSLEADLHHDTLSGETKTRWLDFWNSYLADQRRARALARDGRRVLVGWLRYTLGLGRRRDAFFVGMRESIAAFYRALARKEPLPVSAESAAQVLDWCEAVVRRLPDARRAPAQPARALPAPRAARPGEVCVLGATGFIGRHLVPHLLQAGLPVTCVVRRTHGLPPEIAEPAADGRVRLFVGNLENTLALQEAFAGAKTVLHLATGGGDTWEEVERTMVRGTVAVAGAALENEVQCLVYVSSIAALYTGADVHGPIDDDTATDPAPALRSLYARGKIEAERALLELHREHGLPVVIVRPGVVVGSGTPLQHSGYGLWVRDNHCVGWGAGEHALPLVLVDDVADALVRIARHAGLPLAGRALNLCPRVPLSGRDAVRELARATGRDLHFHARSLVLSQAMEIGKWLVKLAGRRKGIEFPSWRDLKARALVPAFTSRIAREELGWRPIEDRDEFVARAIGIYAPEHDARKPAPRGPRSRTDAAGGGAGAERA